MNYIPLLKALRRFMMDSGATASAVCRKIGMSRETYYRWWWGEIRISGKMARRVYRFLDKFGYGPDNWGG